MAGSVSLALQVVTLAIIVVVFLKLNEMEKTITEEREKLSKKRGEETAKIRSSFDPSVMLPQLFRSDMFRPLAGRGDGRRSPSEDGIEEIQSEVAGNAHYSNNDDDTNNNEDNDHNDDNDNTGNGQRRLPEHLADGQWQDAEEIDD